jgi:DNA-binding SARP family transcriptional activator
MRCIESFLSSLGIHSNLPAKRGVIQAMFAPESQLGKEWIVSSLRIFLFGKFHLQSDRNSLVHLEVRKVQELFCYLLLARHQHHPRESLAAQLWGDYPTTQSKKYLRQTLWQLQTSLDDQMAHPIPLLNVESDWVMLNGSAEFWLDVAEFEQAFHDCKSSSGADLNSEQALLLTSAVDLYQGDLLEGCYQDWCLYERERLQNMLLVMLDKVIDYCETHQQYEMGLSYGTRVLRCEPASERTHQQLMRLHYLAGNRTAALRQYQRCEQILREELDVTPASSTTMLYQQIREDKLSLTPMGERSKAPVQPVSDMRAALERLRANLTDLQKQIEMIELAMTD